MKRATPWIAIAGLAAYVLLPWYTVEDMGLDFHFFGERGTALGLAVSGSWWLSPLALPLLACSIIALWGRAGERSSHWLSLCGFAGFAYLLSEGFAIGLHGWNADWLGWLFGTPGPRQEGMGIGALVSAAALLLLGCRGLAGKGWCRGDAFIVSSIGAVGVLLAVFVFFPVAKILTSAFADNEGHVALGLFAEKITDSSIWGLGCLGGRIACGVAWNTVVLAVLTGVASTALGLAFALIAVRTSFRFKALLRVMTVLPIITPPFVIGLALILMFGRSGAVSAFLFRAFGIAPSRWIYGLTGIFIAQLLAFAPIAFLVLVGVVQGISPTLEEAAQTLRAKRLTIFRTVTWPLMRPGIANAFLLCLIESMADFGNPLVLGGNFEVLSTKIFFAVVGAATDQGRAAVLSLVLLFLTLAGFGVQQLWLGSKSYTTVSGKGDSGLAAPLPKSIGLTCYAIAIPWIVFTFAIYAIIFVGSFVKAVGRDYTPTLASYAIAFRVEHTNFGWFFSGSAWPSLFATVEIALIAAPLTAAIGLLSRLSFGPAGLPRPQGARLRRDAVLRHSWHRGRRELYPRLQRAADRDHGRRAYSRHLFRLPQHAGRRACRNGGARSDRQEPRRGLAHARRALLHHGSPDHAAPPASRARRFAHLCFRARHDGGERRDLPGLGAIQHGDHLHHRPG